MGKMGMDGTGLKRGITCKLHNETDIGCPQECVGDCGKVGGGNGAMQFPDGETHNGMYDAVILEKIDRSRAVRSYADVTREDMKTPLEKNRPMISYIIYFIKGYIH